MPETRGLFLRHQRSIRRGVPKVHFLREWNAKSRERKTEWVAKFNAIEPAKAVFARQREVVNPLLDAVRPPNNGPFALREEYDAFFQRVEQAKVEFEKHIVYLRALRDAWTELDETESRHRIAQRPAEAAGAGQPGNVAEASLQHNRDEFHRLQQELIRARGDLQSVLNEDGGRPVVPNDASGRPKQPEVWAREERENRKYQRRLQLAHTNDVEAGTICWPADVVGNDDWRPVAEFGGGQSAGNLWVCVDDEEYISDRVFRKTAIPGEEEAWRDPVNFEGDVRNQNTRIPAELACYYTLKARNAEGILDLRLPYFEYWMVNNAAQAYKVYTAWAPRGSLLDVIQNHETDGRRIPEPFIWSVAERLAEAGMALAKSDAVPVEDLGPEAPEGARPWEGGEIVHRDWCPRNCFLAAKDSKVYPKYPKCVLGDFGLAIKTSPNDENNPLWYQEVGSKGFRAPEQLRFIDQNDWEYLDQHPMLERTNVYGFGLTLWCLIMPRQAPPEPYFLGHTLDTTLDIPPDRGYGHELLNLVRDCLSYDPAARPSFEDILERVLQATQRPHDRSRGMRKPNDPRDDDDSESDDENDRRNGYMPELNGDRYRIDMHLRVIQGEKDEDEDEDD